MLMETVCMNMEKINGELFLRYLTFDNEPESGLITEIYSQKSL